MVNLRLHYLDRRFAIRTLFMEDGARRILDLSFKKSAELRLKPNALVRYRRQACMEVT